jgi:hypothetical protein
MNSSLTVIAAAAFLAAAPAEAVPDPVPEAELARALKDRVAGELVKCINLRNIQSSRIINRTAILYDAGDTIYVNRPRYGAEGLDDWNILVTKPQFSRLCSIDTVNLYDPTVQRQRGSVLLGEFVPYKRVSRNRIR